MRKSIYGLGRNWPIEWREAEQSLLQADRRLNVSASRAASEDRRSAPYPQGPIPLSVATLQTLKSWGGE